MLCFAENTKAVYSSIFYNIILVVFYNIILVVGESRIIIIIIKRACRKQVPLRAHLSAIPRTLGALLWFHTRVNARGILPG